MKARESIVIEGARTHNLQGLSLEIPKGKVVVFTGVSGSGKSSLVFDTLHTEAQRQLIETFSSFARRRLPKLSRPEVDEIRGLSTSIVIDQKPMGRTLRSTVGTATEIATYLRMLYSRFGDPQIGPSFYFSFNNPEGMCQDCSGLGKRIRMDEKAFYDPSKSLREGAITHPAFKVGSFYWREFMTMDILQPDKRLSEYGAEELDFLLHSPPVPVGKRHGAGTYVKNFEGLVRRLERYYVGKAEDESPEEEKDVYDRFFTYGTCPACAGSRLNERARSVRVGGLGIHEASALEIGDFAAFLAGLGASPRYAPAASVVAKMARMAGHLVDIGAGYLSLDRAVSTLSGGESQRVKMARQLDCDLTGLMYVLDEPSTGLHPKDADRLVAMLRALRDAGNSVLVVEHDPDLILAADWLVEIGPEAGKGGGRLLYSGEVPGIVGADAPTGAYLARREAGAAGPAKARRPWSEAFEIRGARVNNLKDVSVDVPKGVFTCVTGLAGSGKSSLVHEVFAKEVAESIVVDQGPIGRTSRGSAASYIGAFDSIRKEIARALEVEPGLFSFNSKGACPKCGGAGSLAIEMNFLDDIRMTCDRCEGRRYRDEVLALKYKGKDIAEILAMTALEARGFFAAKDIRKRLGMLCDVGLGYLGIGQSLSTLSGGESQRLKLAAELHKEGGVYVMDEPTSGLHMADTERLLGIIDRLVEGGNTVVVIEHNLDVMAAADWIIDMGPGGGKLGGEVVAAGTPEEIALSERSLTGRCLRPLLPGPDRGPTSPPRSP
jgi:excinuclease UvrABC ATPase subunit